MKLLIIPNNLNQIEDLNIDGFIVGVKGLCVNVNLELSVAEINSLNTSKEIFVALNKNIHNADLKYLEEVMRSLKNIKGVLYYDAAVVSLYQKISPSYALVWSQEHLVTNSVTCNYWLSKGVKMAYLSGDITLDEIIKIRENTKMQLIAPIFGYLPMFVSKRHLVKNYLECFNIKDNSNIYYLKKDDNLYPLLDKDNTSVFSAHILNGFDALEHLDVDYITLNAFLIDDDKFKEVVRIFKERKCSEKLNEMFSNLDTCFLYKETIYRVKRND